MIDKNDPRLTAFLLDELDHDAAAEVQAAIDQSPELRKHVDGLRTIIGVLSESANDVVADDAIELSAEQLQQIEAQANPPAALIGSTDRRTTWTRLAVAALFLYAVGLSFVAFRKPAKNESQISKTDIIDNGRPIVPSLSQPDVTVTTSPSLDEGRESDEGKSVTIGFDGIAGLPQLLETTRPQFQSGRLYRNSPNVRESNVELLNTLNETKLLLGDSDEKSVIARGGYGFDSDFDGKAEVGRHVRQMLEMLDEEEPSDPEEPATNFGLQTERELDRVPGDSTELYNAYSKSLDDLQARQSSLVESLGDQRKTLLARDVNKFDSKLQETGRLARELITQKQTSDLPTETENNDEATKTNKDRLSTKELAVRFEQLGRVRDKLSILEKEVAQAKKRAKQHRIRTWKPASASQNRARLSVGHHDDLMLTARDTYVRIDGFRARVFFDLYYYNDRPQQLEGQFLLRLPTDASLHYFAFGPTNLKATPAPPATGKPGANKQALAAPDVALASLRADIAETGTDLARRAADAAFTAEAKTTFGAVKSAHVVPKQKAALAYEETVRRRVDPALVEWAGPGIFQTKVFPLLPNRLHRIVVGYDVNLIDKDDSRIFTLDLPEGESRGQVEFDIAAAGGTQVDISPSTDPFISGNRAYYRYENAAPQDYTVKLTGSQNVALQTSKPSTGERFFATRLTADLPNDPADIDSSRAVFLLDTSFSDRPAAFSRRLELMAEVLKQNRASIKQFAVLMFNVEQRWWQTKYTDNDKKNVNAFLKDADTIVLEGATDLHSALSAATTTAWLRPDDAESLPNYFLLSDAAATWGRTDLASLADPLTTLDRSAGGGALFTYHLAGHPSDKATLQWIANASGGAVFDVAEESDLAEAAIAHRSRPWRVESIAAKGANEILLQGSSHSVYPGQTLMIAGQGELKGPLKIQFSRGKEKRTLSLEPAVTIASPAAARLYGQFAVEQLEPHARELEEVTIAFARYFGVPGRTCSMVMLETEEDYKRFGANVPPGEDRLVIASTSVSESINEMESDLQMRRQNPKQQFTDWLEQIQKASLFNVPTALRLAIKRLPNDTFAFKMKPLTCKSWRVKHVDNRYLTELEQEIPGFQLVMDEADRRMEKFGVGDALKTASTMVEAKPSDPDTLRSVAFRAIKWDRSDQAAPLLWRLAKARPHQPQCLLLLGRSLADSGETDAALVCYDLVCHGKWNQRWASGVKNIAEVELMHLLEKIDSGKAKSAIGSYSRARLNQLRHKLNAEGLDIVVVMHWNTDRTDVDMHVTEPNGETCHYSNNRTEIGGKLTQDITEGLGPEMYSLASAPQGTYKIEANYYNTDTNRTKTPSEVLVTVIRNLGRPNSDSTTKQVTLGGKKEKKTVLSIEYKHQ